MHRFDRLTGKGSTQVVATYEGFGAGITLSFVVADGSNGSPDRLAPRLVGFDVTPDSANMAYMPPGSTTRVISFHATAEDAGGYYAMSVVLRSPDGQSTERCYFSSTPTPGIGSISCGIELSRYGQGGRWTVDELSIGDASFNARSFTAAELAAAGFDDGVTVLNTAVDNGAPVLDSMYFAPDTVVYSGGYQVATVRFHTTDALSGVKELSFSAWGMDGLTHGFGGQAIQVAPGVWEGYLEVRSDFPPAGRTKVTMVMMKDWAGNVTYLMESDLDALGLSAILTVVR